MSQKIYFVEHFFPWQGDNALNVMYIAYDKEDAVDYVNDVLSAPHYQRDDRRQVGDTTILNRERGTEMFKVSSKKLHGEGRPDQLYVILMTEAPAGSQDSTKDIILYVSTDVSDATSAFDSMNLQETPDGKEVLFMNVKMVDYLNPDSKYEIYFVRTYWGEVSDGLVNQEIIHRIGIE